MEEIIVRLGVDSSGFVRVLDQTNEKIEQAGGFVTKLGEKLAAVVSVGAMIKLAKEAIQYASNIADAAEATRTGVEEYQVLAQVARESGASLQQLDQALIKSTLSGEKAAEGSREMNAAFTVLNINVEKFNNLPTERKLEALGAAYNAAGASQAAYAAITEILGVKAGPRLIATLTALGTEGFDAVRVKAEEAGVVLAKMDAQKLDKLDDTLKTWWTRTLVFVGDVISSFDRLKRELSGHDQDRIWLEDLDPERVAARVDAINQLIEQDFAAHQERMASLGSQRNPYYDESAAKAKIVHDINEDEERIQGRINEILTDRRAREQDNLALATERAAAAARQAALDESNLGTAHAVKMVEEGRALIRLKEMTDKERLVSLEQQHVQAVEVFNNMLLLGEGTDKEKEAIAKRVLEIEKQISDTKSKIDAATLKAAGDREKMQGDLLKLIEQEAALQAAITQQYVNRYAQTNEEIAAGGGGSTLNRMVSEVDRLTNEAQRNFDSAARLRAQATSGTRTDAERASLNRAADEAEERARSLDTTRGAVQGRINEAQGQPANPELAELKKIREASETLTKKLDLV